METEEQAVPFLTLLREAFAEIFKLTHMAFALLSAWLVYWLYPDIYLAAAAWLASVIILAWD